MRILLAGDSQAAAVGAVLNPGAVQASDVVKVHGIVGSRIEAWAEWLRLDLLKERADAVALFLGSNHYQDAVLPSLGPIFSVVRRSGASLVWVGPPQIQGRRWPVSDGLAAACAGTCPYVDSASLGLEMRPDQTHPTAKGALDWWSAVYPVVLDTARVDTSDLPDSFFTAGDDMAARLGMDFPSLLLAMNFEAKGIRADAVNPSSGASGLIQLMPARLAGVGFTGGPAAFRALSAYEQLPYIERYFAPIVAVHRLDTAGRIEQALLGSATLDDASVPAGLIYARDGARFIDPTTKRPLEPVYYAGNRQLDTDGKGCITTRDVERALFAAAAGKSRFAAAVARWQALTSKPLPQGNGTDMAALLRNSAAAGSILSSDGPAPSPSAWGKALLVVGCMAAAGTGVAVASSRSASRAAA
jgi:hypothetical protein